MVCLGRTRTSIPSLVGRRSGSRALGQPIEPLSRKFSEVTCCVPSLPKLFARRVVRGDPRADRAAGVCSGGRDGRGLRVRVSAIARASSACFSSCTVRSAFASASRSSRPSLSHYRQIATAPPFPHEQTRSTPPATASFCPFDGPARAIRCACAITESVRELRLDVRACVHTGECGLVDGKGGQP